ncbi:MAG TPA: serine hydrolase [Micromonosporaceae bacterium]|nr:serine hydrolase [Micromonosporaceae bacterium]
MAAVAAGVVLAVPAVCAPAAGAGAGGPAAVWAPAVPCPAPPPVATRPPRPPVPPDDPLLRTVGGAELATAGLVVPPGAAAPPAVSASSWMVADLGSGAVLGGCAPHDYAVPASTQKLLLAATLLPRLDPRQVVTVTRADLDFEPGSSAVGLLEGGRYPVETLWLGLLLDSGNDAANVLARIGGGDAGVAGTIQAMNAHARWLGAVQTHAVTPSGLDGPGQLTSAYDLALIARACFTDDAFRRYAATQRTRIPAQPPMDPRGFEIQNDNQLLLRYPGALGGKTGFTTLARHTFVGVAERDGRRLVVTLLRAEAQPVRSWQQAAALLDWAFALAPDASVGRLVEPGEEVLASPSPAGPDRGPAGGASPGVVAGSAGAWSSPAWPMLVLAMIVAASAVVPIVTVRRRPRRRRPGRRPPGRRASERHGRPTGRSAS